MASFPTLGVGNESWGCGGNMRPEYYADVYRRYQTYVRDFSGNHVFKIAGGANVDDYHWTDVLMREAGCRMDGLSLHYYSLAGPDWDHKGSATAFGESEWITQLRNCLRMDELITRHATIMDRYDPARRVALVVDEWGSWLDVEPGTNPGFLYQQNSLRDALVAALTLNIFNNHSDRVHMANLAQLVNVLQALVLTDGPMMLTTPTYHVFDLYKDHQDAVILPAHLECDTYDVGGEPIPQLSASASRNVSGHILLTLCNVDPHRDADLLCDLRGAAIGGAEGMLLTAGQMQAHNTFSSPNSVTTGSVRSRSHRAQPRLARLAAHVGRCHPSARVLNGTAIRSGRRCCLGTRDGVHQCRRGKPSYPAPGEPAGVHHCRRGSP